MDECSEMKYQRGVEYVVDEETSDDDSDYEYTMMVTLEKDNIQQVNCVQKSGHYQTKLFGNAQVGRSTIRLQIDTGATCNVIFAIRFAKEPYNPTYREETVYVEWFDDQPIGT